MPASRLFNILAVCGSAMFAGAMLVIGVTLGGYWQSLPAADFLNRFGQNNRFIMQAIPLVVIPALVGLLGSLWLGWGEAKARALWSGALLCIALVLALTIAWFVPTNAQLAARSIALDQVPARLNSWLMVHCARIALATVGSALVPWRSVAEGRQNHVKDHPSHHRRARDPHDCDLLAVDGSQ